MRLKRKHCAHLCAPYGTQTSPFQPWPRQKEPTPRLHQLAIQDQELHLCGISHLWLHRPLPFHLLRVECHLALLSAGMRRVDHPLHLGQALRALRNHFVALMQKKARVSGPRESSAPAQPQLPTIESQIPSRMTPEVVIRQPMVTQPPIEGNLDCRARPFHSELCFDIETFRQQSELRYSFHLL